MQKKKKAKAMKKLSHIDEKGRARMVDVGPKPESVRVAVAMAVVKMRPEVLKAALAGKTPKGEVLATARIAGIQAAKQTPALIPLCHPLRIDTASVDFEPDVSKGRLKITVSVRATDRTGVEMEALTGASVAALTVYDMCKAMQKNIVVEKIKLVKKTKA